MAGHGQHRRFLDPLAGLRIQKGGGMNFRNPRFNERGTIDCELLHPALGWVPFTCDPASGSASFNHAAMDAAIRAAGPIAPYVPPPGPSAEAMRATMSLTFAQLLIGLVAEEWITQAEGEAWLSGTLPAPVLALIGALPPAAQFPARARAVRPSVVLRLDPLVTALAAAQGKSDAQLDDFFTTYAAA
jgi:hypothetical protein